ANPVAVGDAPQAAGIIALRSSNQIRKAGREESRKGRKNEISFSFSCLPFFLPSLFPSVRGRPAQLLAACSATGKRTASALRQKFAVRFHSSLGNTYSYRSRQAVPSW